MNSQGDFFMEIVSVNTCNTGNPAGWWYGNPKHAKKCDYLVEHNNGDFCALYTFDDVSERTSDKKFSFKGLKEEKNSIIVEKIKEKFQITNSRNSLHYFNV